MADIDDLEELDYIFTSATESSNNSYAPLKQKTIVRRRYEPWFVRVTYLNPFNAQF